MEKIFTPHSQLVAFFEYAKGDQSLSVTLKDGKIYQVSLFTEEDYSALKAAPNKGAYILHDIFRNSHFTTVKAGSMPAKEVQEIVLRHFAKKNTVNRYRGSEGWGNYLAR